MSQFIGSSLIHLGTALCPHVCHELARGQPTNCTYPLHWQNDHRIPVQNLREVPGSRLVADNNFVNAIPAKCSS